MAAEAGGDGTSARNVRVTASPDRDDQQPSLALDPAHAGRLAIGYTSILLDGAPVGLPGHQARSCGLALSVDDGRTWRPEELVGPRGILPVPSGLTACWNPVVSYGSDGTLYYVLQATLRPDDPYSAVFVTASADGGRSFSAPRPVDPHAPAHSFLRGGGDWWPDLAVDGRSGNVYVTWARFEPLAEGSAILLARSTDGAVTFSPPVRASPQAQIDVTASRVVVGRDGHAHLSWLDYTQWNRGEYACCIGQLPEEEPGTIQRYYREQRARLDYTQGAPLCIAGCALAGQLYTAAYPANGTVEMQVPPAAAVPLGCGESEPDHHCDHLHYSRYEHSVQSLAPGAGNKLLLSWWDTGDPAAVPPGPGRISLAISDDRGRTWKTRSGLGIPRGHGSNEQHRPSLAVAPGGRVDLVYYDETPDGAQDVYWMESPDSLSPSSPTRLSDMPSNAAVGPVGDDDHVSFGEHLAVASSDTSVYAAWTDARRGTEHQSIFFASRQAGHAGDGPGVAAGWWWGLGSAAAALALAAAMMARRPGRRCPSRIEGVPS